MNGGNSARIERFVRYMATVKTEPTAKAYRRGAIRLERYMAAQGLSPETAHRGMLRQFTAALREDPSLSATTVHLLVSGAKRYLEFLRDEGVAVAEQSRPELPRIDRGVPFALQDKTLAAYHRVAYARREPVRTALLLLPMTGMRPDELVKVTPQQIDFVRAREDGITWCIFRQVVGKRSKKRDVPLLAAANPVLKAYLRWHNNRSPWLFPSPRDLQKHLSKRTLRDQMQLVRKELGIEGLTPKTLRATYSTMLEQYGVSDSTISRLMGHASIKTTHDHYFGRAFDGMLEELTRVHQGEIAPEDSPGE